MKELKRYFSYMGRYRARYFLVFFMTLITSVLLNLAYPYMNKLFFNAMEYGDESLLKRAVGICIVLVILKCLAPYRRYLQIRIVRKIVFDIKVRLFEKLLRLDMNYYEKHHSGEVLKILNWDANSLKDSYFSHIFWVVGRLVNGITSVMAMLVYSPVLTAVSVGFCMITVLFSIRINRQIKEMDKEIQSKVTRLTSRLSDILSGFAYLKLCPGAALVYNSFYRENEAALEEEKDRADRAAGLEVITFLLGILGSFGTIGVGAYLVALGQLDYGTVMAIVSLQMSVSTMVQSFGSALTTFSASLVKAGRVFDFLELDCEEALAEHVLEVNRDGRPVEIKDVTFSYDGQREILHKLSMELKQGEKKQLMGESGCGKSTLLKLLMGFYETKEGILRVYGREISEYSLFQLRQLITYIPQSSYLFEGTIGENIAYGKEAGAQASKEEIIHAARLAYADEFIRMLPLGYDTCLTAGGSNLSVGQRQRIALARAFLKDSPILLMDEPSSALDAESENMMYQALEALGREKTVILVTHREVELKEFERIDCFYCRAR